MSAADSAQALRSLSSWKFDLINTANADPLLSKHSAALRLLVLSLKFVRADDKAVYVPNTVAQVQANIASSATVAAARKILLAIGYYAETGKKTGDGAVIYEVRNPRQQLVADHVREATETVKEREAFRKDEERRKLRTKRLILPAPVPSMTEDPKPARPFNDRTDSPSVIEDNHLEPAPVEGARRNRRVSKRYRGADPWEIYGARLRPLAEVQADRAGGRAK